MTRDPPANVAHLRAHGPATRDRLPNDGVYSVSDRRHGMRRLRLTASSNGTADPQGGRNTTVYYLPEHDAERVVTTFLLANPHLVANLTRHGLVTRFGQAGADLQAAARRVLDGLPIRETATAGPGGGPGGGRSNYEHLRGVWADE